MWWGVVGTRLVIFGVACEQSGDVVVGNRFEVVVERSDGEELCWYPDAHEVVCHACEQFLCTSRCHRNRDDDPRGAGTASDDTSSPGRCSRRDAVVDDDRGAAEQNRGWTACSESLHSAIELGANRELDRLELRRCDSGARDDLIVHDEDATLAHSAEPELGASRHPQLADDEDVKWEVELLGDGVCDDHTSAWQSEHQRVATQRWAQFTREATAGIAAVGESSRQFTP
jgi:hypothetical protein